MPSRSIVKIPLIHALLLRQPSRKRFRCIHLSNERIKDHPDCGHVICNYSAIVSSTLNCCNMYGIGLEGKEGKNMASEMTIQAHYVIGTQFDIKTSSGQHMIIDGGE